MPNTIELADTTYQPLAEGKYVFTITDIVYNSNFNRVETKLTTETGRTMFYTYFLQNNDGTANDIQLGLFSRMAKAALNDKNAKSIDPELLKGKQFQAEVKHTVRPSRDNPNENVTFVNLKNYEPVAKAEPAISDDELAAFLG